MPNGIGRFILAFILLLGLAVTAVVVAAAGLFGVLLAGFRSFSGSFFRLLPGLFLGLVGPFALGFSSAAAPGTGFALAGLPVFFRFGQFLRDCFPGSSTIFSVL